MFCEAFHRVFKYSYLKGKANKRVDKCLVNLIKYNRDRVFSRLIKLTKGKVTQRIGIIQARHRTSLGMCFDAVKEIDDNSWSCTSEDGKNSYKLSLNKEICDEKRCNMKCVACNICVHTYNCTCTDYLLYTTICKHTHLLHRFRERNGKVSPTVAAQF